MYLDLFFSYFIIYTKIFQWINVEQNNIFCGKWIFEYLKQFINNAPYVNSEINTEELQRLEKEGINISYPVINSGTISLIFKDKNNDIIIKLKRKNINNKIENTIYVLEWITYLINIKFITNLMNGIKNKFKEQVDFIKEIDNIEYFENNINNKFITTINVNKNLSNDNVIVMSYIKGKTIYELNNDDKYQCLDTFIKTNLYLTYEKYILHLDCHPGNLLFVNNYNIAYIDLGLILKIENMIEIEFIYQLSKNICSSNVENLILAIGNNKNDIFQTYTDNDLINLYQNIKDEKIFNNTDIDHLTYSIKKFIVLHANNNLVFTNNIYNAILMQITVLSVIKYLDVNNQFATLCNKYLKKYE